MARRGVLVSWFKSSVSIGQGLMERQRASYVKLSARRRPSPLNLRLVKMDPGGLPDMVCRFFFCFSLRKTGANSENRH